MRKILWLLSAVAMLYTPDAMGKTLTIGIYGLEMDGIPQKVLTRLTKLFSKAASGVKIKGAEVQVGDLMEQEFSLCQEVNTRKCFQKVYKGVHKDIVIIGKVRKKDSAFRQVEVFLHYYSPTHPVEPRTVSFILTIKGPSHKIIKRFREKLTELILQEKGTLIIKLPVKGVAISIDGKPFVGSSGTNVVKVPLPQGTHTIVLKKGSKSVTKKVEVMILGKTTIEISKEALVPPVPAKPAVVQAEKKPAQAEAPAEKTEVEQAPAQQQAQEAEAHHEEGKEESHSRFNKWQIAFWGSAALTVAMLGGGIYTGLEVKQLERDKESFMKASPNRAMYVGVDDVCSMDVPPEDEHLHEICDEGKSKAMLTNVLISLGIAGGVVTGYFFYRGYIEAPEVSTESEIKDSGSPAVTILPYGGPAGAGLSLTVSY